MDQITPPPALPAQPPQPIPTQVPATPPQVAQTPQPVQVQPPVIPAQQPPTPPITPAQVAPSPLPEPPKSKLPWIIGLIVLVIVGLLVGIFFWLKSRSTTTTKKSSIALVDCTSTINDQPVTIPGYAMKLYAGNMKTGTTSTVDNGTRTFSLKGIIPKTNVSDIYFNMAKNPKGVIAGTKGLIEICDAQNKAKKGDTTKDSAVTLVSKNAASAYYYMHGGTTPVAPGNYRVDAYAYINGSWKLVGRMTGVTITD